jgi:PAS domain S-box-containing protein
MGKMPKKALIVNNDYFFVEFLGELLEKRGYGVVKAYDGKEALGKVEDNSLDIVFADLVMPKVDARQFIQFIRSKSNGNPLPVVALSGAVIEQLGTLDEYGADYYIPKGPINKLTVQLNEFMAEIESQPFFPPTENIIIENGDIFPRREAMELISSLKFYRGIIENIGVGVITVDKDTRVLNVNALALEIVGGAAVEIINRPVAELFRPVEKPELKHAIKQIVRDEETKRVAFYATFKRQIIRAIISPLEYENPDAGWIIALEKTEHNGVQKN